MSHAATSTFKTWTTDTKSTTEEPSSPSSPTSDTSFISLKHFSSSPIFLLAIDFDDTVVDANTDLFIQQYLNVKPLMERIKLVYEKDSRPGLSHGEIYRYYYPATKTKYEYNSALEAVPLVKNLPECIVDLKRLNGELIILSDANSYFIEHILGHNDLRKHFQEIFANPSRFDDKGNLVIVPYHHNLECQLSTVNLCKGRVLTEYLQRRSREGVTFKFVAVAGDGINDFCPMARLQRGDLALPRKDHFICDFIQQKEMNDGVKLKATIKKWSGGRAIVFAIRQKLSELNLL